MRSILLVLALFAGLTAADRPVLVLSGTGQYQPLASGDNYAVRDAANAVLGTGTGTKWGTATSQKQAWYNATPVIQQTGDVATALVTYGLITSPTIVATTAIDSTFRILGSGDPTKKFAVEVDAQTTGKVLTLDTGAQTLDRTLTVPVLGQNSTVAVIDQAQSFAGTQTFTGSIAQTGTGTISTGTGVASFNCVTDASALGTAALVSLGGGSFAKSVYIGGNIVETTALSNISFGAGMYVGNADATLATTSAAGITKTSGSGSAPFDQSGSIVYQSRVSSSAGRSSHLFYTGNAAVLRLTIDETGLFTFTGNISQTGSTTISTGTGAFTHNGSVTIVSGKTLTLSDATASTSTVTGSLINAGGFGNAGAAYIGGLVSGSAGFRTTGGTATNAASTAYFIYNSGSTNIYSYGPDTSTAGVFQIVALSSNSSVGDIRLSISTAGVVSIPLSTDASSTTTGAITTLGGISYGSTKSLYGGSVVLSGSITHGSATLLTTTVALTNGAAAQAGTLLNAPTAGNPTKWVPINDNGTTRYIPAW